jgi:hypothetical protein
MTSASPSTRPYRVVQWATGNIGTRSPQAVIEHPNMTLVGLYVHSDAKAGRDAGELCGLDPVGVRATRNIDDILALGADCVLYNETRPICFSVSWASAVRRQSPMSGDCITCAKPSALPWGWLRRPCPSPLIQSR